ncbi:hypothetical protein BDV11DRAFT_152641 [Aspergillus similis]
MTSYPKMRCVRQSDHETAKKQLTVMHIVQRTRSRARFSVQRSSLSSAIFVLQSHCLRLPTAHLREPEAEVMSATKPKPAHNPRSGSCRFRRPRRIEPVSSLRLATDNRQVTAVSSSALQTRRVSFQSRASPIWQPILKMATLTSAFHSFVFGKTNTGTGSVLQLMRSIIRLPALVGGNARRIGMIPVDWASGMLED